MIHSLEVIDDVISIELSLVLSKTIDRNACDILYPIFVWFRVYEKYSMI